MEQPLIEANDFHIKLEESTETKSHRESEDGGNVSSSSNPAVEMRCEDKVSSRSVQQCSVS